MGKPPTIKLADLIPQNPDAIPQKFEPPNLSNATVAYLVDETAKIRKVMSYLKSADGFYGEALKARMKGDSEQGELFEVERSTSHQERISPDKVRELLTPEQLEKVTVQMDITSLRFRRKGT